MKRPEKAWPGSAKESVRFLFLSIGARLPKAALSFLLRGYKWAISPLFPPACRFVPTCSDFAAEAIERHGAIRGSAMTIWRLVRCHPFVRGGYDPVPLNHPEACSDGPPGPPVLGQQILGRAWNARTQNLHQ